jgi:hypothetical protein
VVNLLVECLLDERNGASQTRLGRGMPSNYARRGLHNYKNACVETGSHQLTMLALDHLDSASLHQVLHVDVWVSVQVLTLCIVAGSLRQGLAAKVLVTCFLPVLQLTPLVAVDTAFARATAQKTASGRRCGATQRTHADTAWSQGVHSDWHWLNQVQIH